MSLSDITNYSTPLHTPLSNMVLPLLNKIINDEKVGIIPNSDNIVNDIKTITINDCTIYTFDGSENMVKLLNQPLGGTITCYVPVFGGNSWLPSHIALWEIQSGELAKNNDVNYELTGTEAVTASRGFHYAKVEYVEEKTVAELVCNAHAYYFDNIRGVYARHTDPKWNATKATLRRFLPTLSGGTDDRVADYGRLVLFLLSKVSLTEEEQKVFAPLQEFLPKAESLNSVVIREAFIQKFVYEAKKDPKAFLEWKEHWGKFWWEETV